MIVLTKDAKEHTRNLVVDEILQNEESIAVFSKYAHGHNALLAANSDVLDELFASCPSLYKMVPERFDYALELS